MKRILGISAYYHDSAAALVINGNIVAAAQEERFSRKKHDPGFPAHAIAYCLEEGQLTLADIDAVVFYDKPLLKFERLLETYLANAPRGFRSFVRAMPVWLKEKLYLKQVLRRSLRELIPNSTSKTPLPPLLFTEHHQSHAASAYYPSPFDHAAVICLDGVGEWVTSSVWEGKGCSLTPIQEIHFPHSLGLLYSAFTYYCGFKVNSGEYKLMGLAPYGKPVYTQTILDNLIDLKDDGSFALDMSYFDYATGETMTSAKFHQLFGSEPYPFDGQPDQRCMDLARSIQDVIETAVLKIAQTAQAVTGAKNACLAGGVALNCVANGRLQQAGIFEQIWIQPAAGDAGGALGAALCAHYAFTADTQKPETDTMQGSYLGPAYDDTAVHDTLNSWGVEAQYYDDDTRLLELIADKLVSEQVVGWFQGRMEFGPRALGNRSILGDPRSRTMQSVMNLKIKQRESFRPFAPIVQQEAAAEYFDLPVDSPYMLLVASVKENWRKQEGEHAGLAQVNNIRSAFPAVTHVDNTARVQTLNADTNARLHALLGHFARKTAMPMLINTSFNVRGEPPVCSPDDALRCFLATDMDTLVMGNWVVEKSSMPDDVIAKAKSVTFEKD